MALQIQNNAHSPLPGTLNTASIEPATDAYPQHQPPQQYQHHLQQQGYPTPYHVPQPNTADVFQPGGFQSFHLPSMPDMQHYPNMQEEHAHAQNPYVDYNMSYGPNGMGPPLDTSYMAPPQPTEVGGFSGGFPGYNGVPSAFDMMAYSGSGHQDQYSSRPPLMHSVSSSSSNLRPGGGPGQIVYAPLEEDYASGTAASLDPHNGIKARRRSSINSNHSGYSGISGTGSESVTLESKTTEATKQAARRRRKDPNSAKFACEYCGETFTRAYNLKGHIRSHEGSKPFGCGTCGKGET
jgi:hypothetical protein